MASEREKVGGFWGDVGDIVVASAPGRVNIIGEHIDYNGYAVLPCALQYNVHVYAAKRVSPSEEFLHIKNSNLAHSDRYLKVDSLDIAGNERYWSDYVVCGFHAAIELSKNLQTTKACPLNILVDGHIPEGAGLSSSSALVVASAFAMATLWGAEFSVNELVQACIKSERLVGTLGGGMDQTVSCFAQQGALVHIRCSPKIMIDVVPIPPDLLFVVADSLVQAHKAKEGKIHFNTRVVECRLAAILLAWSCGVRNGDILAGLKSLKDFERIYFEVCESGHSDAVGEEHALQLMLAQVETCLHEQPYTLDEIQSLVGSSGLDVASVFVGIGPAMEVLASTSSFQLRSRARHVFGEALRVLHFRRASESTQTRTHMNTLGDIQEDIQGDTEGLLELGRLMSASHVSLRDDYDCSCSELDALVAACLACGALGARLTGAGWGGMVVSLVYAQDAEAFIGRLWDTHYCATPHRKELAEAAKAAHRDVAFVTQPGPGASVKVLRV